MKNMLKKTLELTIRVLKTKEFWILFAGVVIGQSIAKTEIKVVEREVTKEVPSEQVVIKEVDSSDLKNWQELKKLDDEIFTIAGSGLGICAESMNAFLEMDAQRVINNTKKTDEMTETIETKAKQRNDILERLGY